MLTHLIAFALGCAAMWAVMTYGFTRIRSWAVGVVLAAVATIHQWLPADWLAHLPNWFGGG